jgi:hypothetical protein
MNFKTFYILKESLVISSITKSEMKPKDVNSDVRKSYNFTYNDREYSYSVSLLGLQSAKQLANITKRSKEDFIGANKDDIFGELTGSLFINTNDWRKWAPIPLDKIPENIIKDVKEIADLKQNLSSSTKETFGDLIDEL